MSEARPVFRLVQGADFARSIRWARRQPRLRDLLAAAGCTPKF